MKLRLRFRLAWLCARFAFRRPELMARVVQQGIAQARAWPSA